LAIDCRISFGTQSLSLLIRPCNQIIIRANFKKLEDAKPWAYCTCSRVPRLPGCIGILTTRSSPRLDLYCRYTKERDNLAGAKGNSRQTKRDTEPSQLVTNIVIFSVTILLISMASLYALQQDVRVHGEASWLISRASAMAAFVVLTVVVILGLILSHPRNKDMWRWTPKLLPWHQALMVALFILLGLHIFFTVTDPKSGVTLSQMWLPIHARYYPIAMVLGSFGLYTLLAVSLSVAVRRWFRFWLPIHRLSWLTWIFVFLHGIYGGSDTADLLPLYVACASLMTIAFVWRNWAGPRRKIIRTRAQPTREQASPKIQSLEGE